MNRRTLLTIAAGAVAAGCVAIGVPAATGHLAYGVPATTHVVYEVADTLVAEMTTPEGEGSTVTSGSSMTLVLNFRSFTGVAGRVPADFTRSAPLSPLSGRMRVEGYVRDFEAIVSGPATGVVSSDVDDVSGDLKVLVSRRGVDELPSFPVVTGAAAANHLFPTLGYALFPRMPDVWVDPGGTWVDTVTVTDDREGVSRTTTLITTHTLVGDTLVGGLMLVHIAVASEIEVEAVMEEPGTPSTGNVTGTVNGSVFWDVDRRLVAYAEYQRDWRSTTTGNGDASLRTWTITGPTRIWRTE